LGHGDGQHALVELGRDRGFIDARRQPHRALEAAIAPFDDMVIVLVVLLFHLLLALEAQDAILDRDIDVVLGNAGQFRCQDDRLIAFRNVDGRRQKAFAFGQRR